jgi:hypothetical protein
MYQTQLTNKKQEKIDREHGITLSSQSSSGLNVNSEEPLNKFINQSRPVKKENFCILNIVDMYGPSLNKPRGWL